MMVYVPVRALRIALALALLIAFGVVTSTGGALAQERPFVTKVFDQPDDGMADSGGDAEADLGASAVIGADDRMRVTPTTALPASAIAMLEVKFGSHTYFCTGAFIGPDALITAAHCVYDWETQTWANSVKVIPGRDGATMPFGSAYRQYASVLAGWKDYGNVKDDWALLTLASTDLGNQVGWFKLSALNDYSLRAWNLTPVIAGYPGDKELGQQWSASESCLLNVGAYVLHYTVDASAGEDGAAIRRGSDNAVVGVHSSGTADYNTGVRVTATMINTIRDMCSRQGCTVDTYIEPDQPDPVFTKKVFLPLVVRN